MAKIVEADEPRVSATVDAPKDPFSCKYTEEGTMVHDLMLNVAHSQRRMRALAGLEVNLTSADKAALTATMAKAAAEKNIPVAPGELPTSVKLL